MAETLSIKVGTLIVVIIVVTVIVTLALVLTYYFTRKNAQHEKQQSLKQSRATIKGNVSEQLAPLLPGFPKDLKPSEAKFLGKPVDFLFFKGMDEGNITDVVFLEVKTGTSSLNPAERKLRNAIREKRVEWREYIVPEEVVPVTPAPPAASKTFVAE
jgi:predicted Holliday junction resolvase-like endonuclease